MLDKIDCLIVDPRVSNLYSCIQCGACTSICPAAAMDTDYNPRRLVECLVTGGDTGDYPLEKCFSCYSCKYTCRKESGVADIVKVLRENGVSRVNRAKPQNETHYKSLYERGLCVTVDALSPDKLPEWGRSWEKLQPRMRTIRAELGLEGLYRALPRESLDEIREIIDRTGYQKIQKEGKLTDVKKRIPGDKIYLFHSCLGDAHYPGITASIKFLFERLDIDYLDDSKHSTCTGFGYYGDIIPLSIMLAVNARNFALAEEAGYPNIAAVCQTTYGVLTECARILKGEIGRWVNEEVLSNVNRTYKGEVTIAHVSEILWAHRDRLKEQLQHSLHGLRVATHNGCHYTKKFRKSAIPHLLEDLVSVTGAEPLDYTEKSLCCGMGFGHTIEQGRRTLSREIARRKLISAKEAGADVVLVACPGCQITLDRNQELIEKESGEEIGLPIINYAQLIALTLGADPYKVVGIQTHSKPLELILEEFGIL